MIQLRPYQSDLISQIETTLPLHRHTMLQLHTGAGKTIIGASLAKRCEGRVLVVVHRQELVSQWKDAAAATGADVEILTIQQLTVRKGRLQKFVSTYQAYDLLIIDEAHHYIDNTWGEIIHEWKGFIVGLTATPYRIDRFRGFERDKENRRVWNKMITGPTRQELFDLGALVPAQVKSPKFGEIDGVGGSENSDFSVSAMMARFAESQLVKAAMTDYSIDWLVEEGGHERKTIIFAVNQIHARSLYRAAVNRGFKAKVIIADTPSYEREIAFAQFLGGALNVLITVAVLTEGIDLPACDTALIVRPTKSLALYMQMVGRVVRPSAGKTKGCILDPSGNYTRFGHIDNEFIWSLKPMARDNRLPKICESCYTVNSPDAELCDGCGIELKGNGGGNMQGIRCMECGRVRPINESQCKACNIDPDSADLKPEDSPVRFSHRNIEWLQDEESENGLVYVADLPHLEAKASIVQHGNEWTGQIIADDDSYLEMLVSIDDQQRVALTGKRYQIRQPNGYAAVNTLTDKIRELIRLS